MTGTRAPIFVALIGALVVCAAYPAATVYAATYTASTERNAGEIRLTQGQVGRVFLSFQNTSDVHWVSGRSNVSLYVYGDSSPWKHATWLTPDLIAPLTTTVTKPGERGTVSFLIQAPSIPGTYTQDFVLGSGGSIWIKGSRTTVKLIVTSRASVSTGTTVSPVAVSAPATAPVATIAPSIGVSSGYEAALLDRGGLEWQVEPLGHLQMTLRYKNTGTTTWTNAATMPVVLGPSGGRISPFKDFSWKNDQIATTLKEKEVKPGQEGTFVLQLRGAPLPGSYQERFQLFVNNATVAKSDVILPVRVTMPLEYISKGIPDGVTNGVDVAAVGTTPVASVNSPVIADGSYRAALLIKSVSSVALSGNARQPLTVGFKNTGTSAWNQLALRLEGMVPAITEKWASLRDESWATTLEPVRQVVPTPPGHIGFLSFKMKVPAKKGKYTAKFQLFANEQRVADGMIDIPITVTADGYIEPEPVLPQAKPAYSGAISPTGNAPLQSSLPSFTPQPLGGDPATLAQEPLIRVGIFATTDDQMRVRAMQGGMWLSEGGARRCSFGTMQEVLVRFERTSNIYRVSGPGCDVTSASPFQLRAEDGLAPLEMTDFSRPVGWLPGANDNSFRSVLELRYAPKTNSVWVINELPVEWYLKGIAETSNTSPVEFQRALLTIARTYAMYHVTRGTKHAAEFYTVDAKYDQVYRGYGSEARTPNVVAAVDATRGQIVTYEGKLAITPYFSRSDGRTRNWTEVWGGSAIPWLVSVSVPQDQGKTLWGHGVGLSATGALGMASEGKMYPDILKHFYRGTELRQAYR